MRSQPAGWPWWSECMPVTNNLLLVIAVGRPFDDRVRPFGRRFPSQSSPAVGAGAVCHGGPVVAAAGPLRFYYPPGAPRKRDLMPTSVLTANLRYGLADARFFIDLAGEEPTWSAFRELTPPEAQQLAQLGIGEHFPYSVFTSAEAAGGAAIWSRYPLEELDLKRPKSG